MKRIVVSLSIIILLIAIGIITGYLKFSKKGLVPKKLVAKFIFGKDEKSLGEFVYPRGLAIKNNRLYVADTSNNRLQILKINPDGSLTAQSVFGKGGAGLGEFEYPEGLAMKNDYLYVADRHNNRLQILKINPDGSLTPYSAFGKGGTGLGEFNSPTDLAIKDDHLYVTDYVNSHIQILKINSGGNLSPKFIFGKKGKGLGEFEGIFGFNLAIKDNYLYVGEAANSRIQILKINPDGGLSPKFTFGKQGQGLGEFGKTKFCFMGCQDIPAPIDLSIKDNHLFVADSGNNRIQVLEIKY